jgi:hypothetical protein
MRKPKITSILASTIVFAGALAFYLISVHDPLSSIRDPIYKGRKLTAILDENIKKNTREGCTENWKESQEAVEFLGPQAVPLVLKKVRNSNSGMLSYYRKFRQEAAPGLRRFLPAFDVPVFLSYSAGHLISPMGEAAVPWLIKGLNDHCTEVRLTCVRVLQDLCYEHPEKRKDFLPLFISAAHDATAKVRLFALTDMQKLGADAKPAIPTLLWALSSSQAGQKENPIWNVHGQALMILGKIGKEARETLPIIESRLNDTNSYTRFQAAVAVWRIDHDFQTVFPVLTNLLIKLDEESRWPIFETLGEMGANAAPAVPLIQGSLESDRGYIVTAASNALVKIIPPGQHNSYAK